LKGADEGGTRSRMAGPARHRSGLGTPCTGVAGAA
jgi:hypothetical protein